MPKDSLSRMLRVDQAGEYGAVQIYQGQIEALEYSDNPQVIELLTHMQNQEIEHLKTFNKLLKTRNIKPSKLQPLWHVAGYTLGFITAKMDIKAAMACTVAVEEVIDKHYQKQLQELVDYPGEQELTDIITKFRQEEIEHKETALANDAEQATGYKILSTAIKSATKLAIWLSKRI